jgi:hypothetical protein
MNHILNCFPELAEAFKKTGRSVQIRVYPPRHHALGGYPYRIEVIMDDKNSLVDIRLDNSKIDEYSFQMLDMNAEEKKLVLGVRRMGKVVKTYFFDRNNGGKPESNSGLLRIADYESALAAATFGKKSKNTISRNALGGMFSGNPGMTVNADLCAQVSHAFDEIGLTCRDGFGFGVGTDDSVSLNLNRISAVLDINASFRQILLKGNGEVNYLCGMDERHPFIALVNGDASNVKVAHEKLQPGKLHSGDNFSRQGEWFFIKKNIPVHIGKMKVITGYELKRNGRSKSHVIETAVIKGDRIYARGWVEHEDHKPLFLDDWHLVQLNNEVTEKYFYNYD